jgi:hypothetical protein
MDLAYSSMGSALSDCRAEEHASIELPGCLKGLEAWGQTVNSEQVRYLIEVQKPESAGLHCCRYS